MNPPYGQVFFGSVIGLIYVWFLCLAVIHSRWLSRLHAVLMDVALVIGLISIANKCDQVSYLCWGVGIAVVMDLVGRICKYSLRRSKLKNQV
jgi:NhaP-type Na+/H+ or K+/H+ antiporter